MIEAQSHKVQAWLLSHGAAAAAPGDEVRSSTDEEDWAADARRWYEERSQGVDVAQLLPYHQKAEPQR